MDSSTGKRKSSEEDGRPTKKQRSDGEDEVKEAAEEEEEEDADADTDGWFSLFLQSQSPEEFYSRVRVIELRWYQDVRPEFGRTVITDNAIISQTPHSGCRCFPHFRFFWLVALPVINVIRSGVEDETPPSFQANRLCEYMHGCRGIDLKTAPEWYICDGKDPMFAFAAECGTTRPPSTSVQRFGQHHRFDRNVLSLIAQFLE
jgi:hypothetical protein